MVHVGVIETSTTVFQDYNWLPAGKNWHVGCSLTL